jgi:3-oxoacyl-[acyl-carrier-protein] synthase III
MHGFIAAVEYALPEHTLDTKTLVELFPEWDMAKIDAKTGIHTRHIAASDEYVTDLSVAATTKLFDAGACEPDDIDFLLLCTQSPDYALPTTACILQHRLGISSRAGALDFNLGCSGYVYGLGLAEGLIVSGQANSILLITADTYSKYLKFDDKSSRAIFGDGAAATLIKTRQDPQFGPFLYGTDGRGWDSLIVRNSGLRGRRCGQISEKQPSIDDNDFLYMDGGAIFSFVIKTVPQSVKSLLYKASLKIEDIRLFIFHQANAYLLEEVRRILGIASDKVQITLDECGNTVSSTIPIAIRHADLDGKLLEGDYVVLVGFGVGYSWSATVLKWSQTTKMPLPLIR